MVRRLIHVFLFAICSLSSHAQIWCPPGATWTYDAGLLLDGFRRMSYVGDTLIDGYMAQKIDRYTAERYPQPPPGPLYSGPPIINYSPLAEITRFNDEVVFIRQGTEWDTLFWIGAGPGDRWTAAHITGSDCDPFIVSETGTAIIDGLPLRYVEGENWPRVYERIGSIWDLYLYCPNWIIDGPTGMRCYQDDGISFINAQGPCELLTGIPLSEKSSTLLFPNPGTDHFTLNNIEPGTAVEVFDLMGRSVILQLSTGTSLTVDAHELAPGSYFVQPNNDQLIRWTKQ